MAFKHASAPQGGKTPELGQRSKKLVEFWKSKEKAPDVASSSSSSPLSSPAPSQTKPINIPSAAPSLNSVQEVSPISATAQLRTNNNVNISASLTLNTTHSTTYSSTPTTHLFRGRTGSEAIPVSHSVPINLQNRMRTSQEGDIIITHNNSPHPNGIEHGIRLNKSTGLSLPSESSSYKTTPSSSSSTPTPNTATNSFRQSPTTTHRSTSLQSVQEPSAAQLAHRRRSLNEKLIPSEFSLQERPPKSLTKSNSTEEISALLRKIQESEILLNALETQLKQETLKRIDNPYSRYSLPSILYFSRYPLYSRPPCTPVFSLPLCIAALINFPSLYSRIYRELEATLQKGDGDNTKGRGEAEQNILEELENFKKLHERYKQVLDEVTASKDALAKLTERLSSTLDADLNHKRRWVRMRSFVFLIIYLFVLLFFHFHFFKKFLSFPPPPPPQIVDQKCIKPLCASPRSRSS